MVSGRRLATRSVGPFACGVALACGASGDRAASPRVRYASQPAIVAGLDTARLTLPASVAAGDSLTVLLETVAGGCIIVGRTDVAQHDSTK